MKMSILCGLPGSGKSTWAQKQAPAEVVSADDFFLYGGEYEFDPAQLAEAHAYCLRRAIEHCQRQKPGADIIVDNTNTTVAEIAPYTAVGAAYGFTVEIHVFDVDVDTATARNIHGVPRRVIEVMHSRLSRLRTDAPPWWQFVWHGNPLPLSP